jgi:FKBP12-rapamycin complex-associated protein
MRHVAKAQAEVYDELQARTAYLDFSASNYASAITTLAKSQMLVEVEEVIRYKQSDHHPELQKVLADTWQSRLKSSHVDVDSFYKRLLLWSLAAKPEELQDGWLYLAKLAHEKGLKSGRRIIESLGKDDQPGDKVFYTKLRFDWEQTTSHTQKGLILHQLFTHAQELSSFCGFSPGNICRPERWVFPQPDLVRGGTRLHRRRLARSLVRLSQWTREYRSDWIEDSSVLAYEHIGTAVMLDPNWAQALGALAEMALEIQQYKQSMEPGNVVTEAMVKRYILPACYGRRSEFDGIRI